MPGQMKSICIFSVLVLMVISETSARPNVPGEYNNNKCLQDNQVIEICQRCAKVTKSPIVYPMCCKNEDDVFAWCDQYINFGRKP